MKRLYLSGPMSGFEDFNYPAFDRAEVEYKAVGFAVENPARHFGGSQDESYEDYLFEAIRSELLCDSVVLLPGWFSSYGANVELVVAQAIGLEVIDYATGKPYQKGWPLVNGHRLVKGRNA